MMIESGQRRAAENEYGKITQSLIIGAQLSFNNSHDQIAFCTNTTQKNEIKIETVQMGM